MKIQWQAFFLSVLMGGLNDNIPANVSTSLYDAYLGVNSH